jgi:ATP/maltotriose-dependent transcriptional regulator MalT
MGGRVEDGPGPVLIATKLRPPAVRDQVVPRERLAERLRSGSGLGLSLVACPAGYGKTTLLAAWHEAEAARKPVAWLTLDDGDNDPVVLWSYVIQALRGPARPSARRRRRSWPGRGLPWTWCCRAW